MDEELVQVHLEASFLQDSFLNRGIRNESQYDNLLLLTYSMSSVLSLEIHLRVPVRVKQNDSVGSLKIEA